MRPTRIALRIAAEHACDFGDSLFAGDDHHVGGRDTTSCALADDDVMVCARGDLRQMRDREHLMKRGDVTQRFPDLESDSATDPGIDFVEDQRRHTVEPCEDGLQGQRDARQLTARCNAREEASVVTNIQSDTEFDRLGASRTHVCQRDETNAKPPVGHAESGEILVDRSPELRRPALALLRQLGRERGEARASVFFARL